MGPNGSGKSTLSYVLSGKDGYEVTGGEAHLDDTDLLDLEPEERAALERCVAEDKAYYVLEFSNIGGLVMPIILGLEFSDGTKERLYIPAEIWRRNAHQVRKLLVYDKGVELKQVIVDPNWETADADVENNYYPRRMIPTRVEAFKAEPDPSFVRKDIMNDINAPLVTPEDGAADEPAPDLENPDKPAGELPADPEKGQE